MEKRRDTSTMRLVETIAGLRVSGKTLGKLEQLATRMGIDERRIFQLYVEAKNKANLERFVAADYNDRILLLPQCLRSRECKAELSDLGYICRDCIDCRLAPVIQMARELGYRGIYITPGGNIVAKIFERDMPKACLGVACLMELVLGSMACEKFNVVGQGIPLNKDGCIDTDVDWNLLHKMMQLHFADK